MAASRAKTFDLTPVIAPNRIIYSVETFSNSSEEISNVNSNNVSASDLRTLRLCSYFLKSDLVDSHFHPKMGLVDRNHSMAIAISKTRPLKISFNAVKCSTLESGANLVGTKFFFDLFNAMIVGLVGGGEDGMGCLGLGIVTKIDCELGLIYVSTPIENTILIENRVNHLVLGKLELPLLLTNLGR